MSSGAWRRNSAAGDWHCGRFTAPRARPHKTCSRPVIEHAYREFLLQNHNPDEREYPDAAEPECWALKGLDRMQAFGYTLYNLWRYEYGY